MHELMFQAGVKGMSERSELIPCISYNYNAAVKLAVYLSQIQEVHISLATH